MHLTGNSAPDSEESGVSRQASEPATPTADGAQGPTGRPRKQRTVMATDSDWALIKERAAAAGRSVSEYVIGRLTAVPPAPATDNTELDRRLRRVEVLVQTLYEIEAHRLRQHGDKEVLDDLLRRADATVGREETLG